MATKQEADQVNSCLNIMRRMPPSNIEMNLSGLLNLLPELTEEILQRVDQPLQLEVDTNNNKKYKSILWNLNSIFLLLLYVIASGYE